MTTSIKQFLQKAKKQSKIANEDVPIEIHHALMKEYGWIPLEEFEQLPIPTILNLLDKIRRDGEEREKAYKKSKSKTRLNKKR